MLTVLLLLVLAAVALGLLLLAAVIAGIRSERPSERLSIRAPGPFTATIRRLLGVQVRRPGDTDPSRGACLAGHATGRDAEGTGTDDGGW
jgi:hypothetical protein